MPDVPFEIEEYRRRAAGVREEMARRDIDVLFVTSAPNTCYLTGFESIWYPPRAPVGIVVTRDAEQIVFCDYERHQNQVQMLAHFDDAIFYAYTTAIDTIASEFQRRGWCDGTVGIEYWSINPGPPLLREVADAIAARGAKIVAGDWVVNRVRADQVARRDRPGAPRRADRRRGVRAGARRDPARHDRAADLGPRRPGDGRPRRRAAPPCGR